MINNLLALSINQYQISKKMCLNLNSFTFKILFFLTSASFVFGQTDFLSSLVYDATKTYEEGESVIPSVDLSDQIYTARKSVPLDTPPVDSSGEISNEDYWATSGDYTTELATSNSAALSDVPDDAIVDTQQVENLGTPTEDTGDNNEVFARLVNLSSRAYIDGNDPAKSTLIVSFIIEGSEKKSILVRGISHSMDIDDPLPNPSIYVNKTVNGVLDENFISNNDWEDDSALVSSLNAHRPDLLPSSGFESALILRDLEAGAYSVVLSAVSPGGESVSGVALIDAYEWNVEGISSSNVINLSSTGFAAPMGLERIPSFIIEGEAGSKVDVVIRALGPGLTDAFGLTGVISDPQFNLVNAVTGDFTEFPLADDWGNQTNSNEISNTGYAPPNAKDAAMLVSLPPGAYSVIGQATTNSNIKSGTISVEVFDVSNRN